MPGPNLGPPKIVVAVVGTPGGAPVPTTALTDAQLRATPVPVTSSDPLPVENIPTTLSVTQSGAQGDKATATLPAAGPGNFHCITQLELVKLYAQTGSPDGAGVTCTSTNLPGNPFWITEQIDRIKGFALQVLKFDFSGNPLQSVAADTDTTLFAPSQADTIWCWNVTYFVAPAP